MGRLQLIKQNRLCVSSQTAGQRRHENAACVWAFQQISGEHHIARTAAKMFWIVQQTQYHRTEIACECNKILQAGLQVTCEAETAA